MRAFPIPRAASMVALFALIQGQGSAPPSPFARPPVEEDAVLIAKINEAIRRGEEWLLSTQGEAGSWNGEERGARIGYTELVLYALAVSGEGKAEAAAPVPKDPAPKKGAKPEIPHAAKIVKALEKGFEFV